MERASPALIRKSLEAANIMAKAGIMFVPIPVASVEDATKLWAQSDAAFDSIIAQAEKDEGVS